MFFYHMTTAICSKVKMFDTTTMEEWLIKMLELTELAKITSLVREKTIFIFMDDWKSLTDFLHEIEKNCTYNLWFN